MNLVSSNKYIGANHNLLDRYFYEELKSSSNILKYYDKILSTIDVHLLGLDEDVFYMLYKHIFNTSENNSLKDIIINELLYSGTLDKIRTRTVGSTFETYLSLKYIMDQLIIRMRGTERITELRKLIEGLNINQYAEAYSSILEKFERLLINDINNNFNIFRFNNLTDQQVNALNKSLLDTIEQIIRSLNTYDLSNELKGYLLSKLTLSDITSSSTSTNLETNITIEDFINQLDDNLISGDYSVNSTDEINESEDDLPESDSPNSCKKSVDDHDNADNDDVDYSIDDVNNTDNESSSFNLGADVLPENQYSIASLTDMQRDNSQKLGSSLSEFNNNTATDKTLLLDSKVHGKEHLIEEITGFLKKFDMKSHYNKVNDTGLNFDSMFKMTVDILSDLSGRLIKEQSETVKLVNTLNIQGILDSTVKKIDFTSDNLNKMGISSHSLKSLDFDEAIELDKRLSSSEFRKFIDKVGKKKAVAKKARKMMKSRKDKVVDKLILSDDIDYIAEEEMMNLSLGVFEFEWDFYDRYLNRGILTYELVSNDSKSKGPVVLCYDGSGSMEGNKILETKAHIIAIIEIAKMQKRNLVLIQFSSKDEPLIIKELSPVNVSPNDIFEIYDTFIRGGTDFEKPLKKAMEYLTKSSYKDGDILFITDGFCEITARFINQFLEAKIQNKFKLYSIIIQGQTYHDYGDLGKLSDEVLEIKRSGGSEWNDKVSEHIFSLI